MQRVGPRVDHEPNAESLAAVRGMLLQSVGRHLGADTELTTSIPALQLFRCADCTAPMPALYEPCLSIVLNGRKRIVLGERTLDYDESSFLLACVELPVISAVIDTSRSNPFISLLLRLDLNMAREMITAAELHDVEPSSATMGLSFGPVTRELLEPLDRLVSLLDTPRDIPVMGDMLQREILYRVLTGPAGGQLRQTALLGTRSNRTARAIAWLRENYVRAVRIEELAEIARMGVSTFHHHFRAMTTMSPLQYQKQLRLHEARRLMLAENIDAGSAALNVGYESSTQFSREYRRLFGAPPLRDIKALRATA